MFGSVTYYSVFTFNFRGGADLYAGYELSLIELPTNAQSQITNVFTPQLYLQTAAYAYAEINIYNWWIYRITANADLLRVDPLDAQLVWGINSPYSMLADLNPDPLGQICLGLNWATRGLGLSITTNMTVNECSVGLAGYYTSSTLSDCN